MNRDEQELRELGLWRPWGVRMTQKLGWWLFVWILKYWCGLRVENAEVLNGLEQCVFAPTHASHLDFWAVLQGVPTALRRQTYVAAAQDHFFSRFFRRTVTRLFSYHNFALNRQRASHIEYQRLFRMLETGKSLLMFAQGTRTRDGGLLPFKPMLAMLALDAQVPIVPVAVIGTFEAMPVGRFWPRRHPICVRFAKPIMPVKPDGVKKLSKLAKTVNNDLMQTIEQIYSSSPDKTHRTGETA